MAPTESAVQSTGEDATDYTSAKGRAIGRGQGFGGRGTPELRLLQVTW